MYTLLHTYIHACMHAFLHAYIHTYIIHNYIYITILELNSTAIVYDNESDILHLSHHPYLVSLHLLCVPH